MTPLRKFREKGFEIFFVDQDDVGISPTGLLTDEQKIYLMLNKPEIMAELRSEFKEHLAKLKTDGYQIRLKPTWDIEVKYPVTISEDERDEQRTFFKRHKAQIIEQLLEEAGAVYRLNTNEFSSDWKINIMRWLNYINQNKQPIIDDLLIKCQTNLDARHYFLNCAAEIP
jgi:hypothetical protein